MLYLSDSDKELFITIERLLLDSKVSLAMTSDVGTSTEVSRKKIRMAAKKRCRSIHYNLEKLHFYLDCISF